MLAILIAAALAQPNIVAVLADAEAHGNRVELLERPAGIGTAAFVDQLLEEAGASGWERMDREVSIDGTQVRMLAARSPGTGLLLYIPLGPDARAICRVAKTRPVRTPHEERRRIDRFCVRGLVRSN